MTTTATAVVSVRIPVKAVATLEQLAAARGLPLSAWLREQLVEVGAWPQVNENSAQPPPSALPALRASQDNLEQTVSTRLTKEQFALVAQRATDCALPLAAYVRLAVLGITPRQQLPLTTQAVVHLARIGNNLNQLSRLANSGTLYPQDLVRVIQEALGAITNLRNALRDETSA